MFRKCVFWTHLISGVVTGAVVLMMSVTGVLLTYERQMLAWAERSMYHETPAAAAVAQPLLTLVAAAREHDADFRPTAVTIARDSAAPAVVGAGRAGALYVNRYTGDVLGEGPTGMREFFRATTGWHRWFNVGGEGRDAVRAITGASNLAFLFLIVSGMYLWLPKVLKWMAFKTRLFFNPLATSAKARDLNWHHVFGIWTALPLAIVVATATVFSYGWANDLVYRSFGEEPPQRGGARGAAAPVQAATVAWSKSGPRSLDDLLARAEQHVERWERITVQLPDDGAAAVSFNIDQGNGGQPQRRHSLVLDAATGEVREWQPFESQSAGRQARSIIRFLHTGEALGLAGQTIAGLVSLTSVLMVWTGFALAYRRLVQPLLRRKKP